MSRPLVRRLLAGLTALLSAALLALNTPAVRPDRDLATLAPAGYKFWEDLAIAVAAQVNHERAATAWTVRYEDWPAASIGDLREVVAAAVDARGIRSWQFWRTIPSAAFREQETVVIRSLDDRGRAVLLGRAFRLLGGVAPYLLVWLGAVSSLPVLAWTAYESFAAGRAVAGAIFLALVGATPFVAEMLALAYSSAGFYLLGLLLLVPLALYAARAHALSRAGLHGRALAAGSLFAAYAICRSAVVLLLPAFVLALAVCAWRLRPAGEPARPWWRDPFLGTTVVAVLLFAAPYAVFKHHQRHEVWLSLWEGLGDFDRTKGHSWSDAEAKRAVRAAGGGEYLRTPHNEGVFFRMTMNDIAGDPLWYATILAKRVLSTLTQRKLWPSAAHSGSSIAPASHRGEGVMDAYYRLTTTADWLGVGRGRAEMPVWLLALPGAGLVLAAIVRRRAPSSASTDRLRLSALVLGGLAAAALITPVVTTTAAAAEPQGFVLVYLLGWAFCAEWMIALVVQRFRARA
jgi:hypothetical protein